MKCQPAIFFRRCICLFWLGLLPCGSTGWMLMAMACEDTCWWPRPLHACHFPLACVAQLSESVLWVTAGTGPGRQKSEWQLKTGPSSQTSVRQRTSACSWHFHHIHELKRTYLLKAVGFSYVHRSLESFLLYSWRKWHLQKSWGTFVR